MLIAQKIANLLNGVSQKPPEYRPSAQAEVQENIISDRVLGLRRRPPTKHIAQLTPTTAGYDSAFVHQVRESDTDRYYIAVVEGDLKVYDAISGAAEAVTFPSGKSYLTSTKGFKAFTVGSKTYLVNMDTVVRRGTKKAASQINEALIFVRQADYSTNFTVTVDGNQASITTADASAPQAREQIDTEAVATQILQALQALPQVNTYYTLIQYGSTLYLTRADGKAFTIASTDGLADKGLKIVQGSVQTFADLPTRAQNGMIVEIAGDPESAADDYWVQYSDQGQPQQDGVWQECAAPGTPVNLDPTTMPWILQRAATLATGLTAHQPIPPSIVPITAATSGSGGTADPDTGITFTGVQDVILSANNQKIDGPVTGADGGYRILRVYYDVDTTLLDVGMNVTVQMYLNGGSGFTLLTSRPYDYGITVKNDYLEWLGAVPTGSTARIEIQYGTNGTPTSRARTALVTVHAGNATGAAGDPGISSTYVGQVVIGFIPTALYPAGTSLTLHLNTSGFTYTVGSTDQTGDQVAAGLTALITGFTAAHPAGSGEIQVSNTGSTPITWTATVTIAPSATTLFDPTASLTPGALVGNVLKNDTDGSTGTITANSVYSITVSGMSGGISNVFNEGDVCEVGAPANTFVFTTETWGERTAGSLDTCPMPSFVDSALNEIFFYQNRLGFTAGTHIVMSSSGDLTNFMRYTATQLLPDDVIDIVSAFPTVSTFENAMEWNDLLYLFSNAGHQFALEGTPDLSPQTVTLTHKSSFPMTGNVRPVTAGKYLYFGRAMSTYTQIMQYFLTLNGRADAVVLSLDVPQYISGQPVYIVNDPALEFIAILSSGEADALWVYSYHYEGDQTSPYAMPQKTMGSWSKWTFSGAQVVAIDMLDGVLSMIVIRSDGVYLEQLDVGTLPNGSADYRDRQGSGSPVNFTSTYQISTLFMRDKEDTPETRGRLQLRYGTLNFHDSTDFTVTVTPLGRAPYTYTYHSASPETGDFQFPIQTRNLQATIVVTSTNAGGFAFSGFDWEGDYTTRAKRV